MNSSWEMWRYRIRETGPIGMLGLGLIVVSLLWAVSVTIPLYVKAQQLESNTQASRKTATSSEQTPPDAATSVAKDAKPATSMDSALKQLFDAASSNGVRIDRGEYSVADSAKGATTRYTVLLPARGSYPALRAFLSQALNGNPGLVLEQLRFTREENNPDLSASLKFSLTLGAAR